MRNMMGALTCLEGLDDGRGVVSTSAPTGSASWGDVFGVSIATITTPTALVDQESGRILACNILACKLLEQPREQVVGALFSDHVRVISDDGDITSWSSADRLVHDRTDGSPIHLRQLVIPTVAGGRPAWLTMLTDITAEAKAADQLRHEREFLADVVATLPVAIFVKDLSDRGRYVLCTNTTEDMANVPRDYVLGRTDEDAFPPASAEAFRAGDARVLASGQMETSEATICRRDGTLAVTETRKMLLPSRGKPPRYVLGMTEDITHRREIELRLARVAMLDPLTGLANRMLFREKLKATLKARRADELVVLHCLDLDQFKGVNDTLGHAAGDQLLTEVGARLEAICGSSSTVARLGGDEFAIIQGPITSLTEANDLAARVARSLRDPIHVEGKTLMIGSSTGLAVAPLHGDDPDTLARSADMALYGAKEEERGTYRFFEPAMAARIQARHRLEEDLREALATSQLELFYQPIIDIGSGQIAGFEALLRWNHPERGFVPPAVIIPVAEESGLIVQVGEWVLRAACLEAATWSSPYGISVNLSSVQFRNPNLADTVADALADAGLAAHRLELEITESVLLTDNQANLDTLHRLRDLGIRISLDDFGTGYSSLGYLNAFPFHKIKIDRSFVQDIEAGSNGLAIVRSVIKLADDLGMTTTAEGVETAEQFDRLRLEGCTQAQGYLFDRPRPANTLPDMMRKVADAIASA